MTSIGIVVSGAVIRCPRVFRVFALYSPKTVRRPVSRMRSCQVVRLWHQLDFKGLKGTDARSLQLDFPKLTSAFHRSRVSTGEVAASGSFTFASDRHIDNA